MPKKEDKMRMRSQTPFGFGGVLDNFDEVARSKETLAGLKRLSALEGF